MHMHQQQGEEEVTCPSAPLVWKRKSAIQPTSSSSSSSSFGGGGASSGNNGSESRQNKRMGDVTPSLVEKLLSAWK